MVVRECSEVADGFWSSWDIGSGELRDLAGRRSFCLHIRPSSFLKKLQLAMAKILRELLRWEAHR